MSDALLQISIFLPLRNAILLYGIERVQYVWCAGALLPFQFLFSMTCMYHQLTPTLIFVFFR